MRRIIFVYGIAMSFGIFSAFITVEKEQVICALIFIACACCGAIFMKRSGMLDNKNIKHCALFAFVGFALFVNSFLSYANLRLDGDRVTLEGTVRKSEISTDKVSLEINTYGRKVLCKYYFRKPVNLANDDNKCEREKKLRDIKPGDKIRALGTLRVPDKARNPKGFDYRLYLKTKGIGYILSSEYIVLNGIEDGAWWKVKRYLHDKKSEFIETFAREPEVQGFIKGVIFGDKSGLDDEVCDEFNENMTAHILAVSGLHVGFILSLLRILSGRRKNLFFATVICAFILLYGEITGWNIPTVRSVIVISVGVFSMHLRRQFDLLSATCAAAMTILACNPYLLFGTSFQMSFIAMLGIAFFTKPISYFLGEYAAVMTGIQVATMPYTAFVFNSLNPIGILVNIPIILLASILVPTSIIMLFIDMTTGCFPGIFADVISGIAILTLKMNKLLNFGGSFSLSVISGGLLISFLFYGLVFFISSEQARVWMIRREKKLFVSSAVFIMILAISAGLPFINSFRNDEIVFLDVGQGDAVHVRAYRGLLGGEKEILCDGGGSRNYNIGKNTLKPYFLKNGAEHVDMNILSHLHMDHYKAARELSEVMPVHAVALSSIYSKNFTTDNAKMSVKVDRKNIFEEKADTRNPFDMSFENDAANIKNPVFLSVGDEIRVNKDVKLTVLWPKDDDKNRLTTDNANEMNMVVMLEYKGVRTMITGDLLKEDEEKMVDYYMDRDGGCEALRCDILKVAHHGSKSSTCSKFLKEANPQIAIVQVGRNNLYGHPHSETLKRLKRFGARIYRTDENGAVGIDIDHKGKIRVHTML